MSRFRAEMKFLSCADVEAASGFNCVFSASPSESSLCLLKVQLLELSHVFFPLVYNAGPDELQLLCSVLNEGPLKHSEPSLWR